MHPALEVHLTKCLAIDCFCAFKRRTDTAEMNYSPQVAADTELQEENEKTVVVFMVCKHLLKQTALLQLVRTVTWGSETGRLTAARNIKHKL